MLTAALLWLGAVLVALVLLDRPLRAWPVTPAVLYLLVGAAAGAVMGAPALSTIEAHAHQLLFATELAVLMSLFAVGVRVGVPQPLRRWRVALLMSGPGMVAMVLAGTLAAQVLQLPWAGAFLLAAVLAPTDPVLASEVQMQSDDDRDAVRLSLTAEGGLNDGSALPLVMLALGLLGLHPLGPHGADWLWADLLWPIGGGALIGVGLGWLLGHALRARVLRNDPLARDELLFVGAVALAFGLARATHTSTFIVMFMVGTVLLWPLHHSKDREAHDLSDRLHAFGARAERLVEAVAVLAVGVALHSVQWSWRVVVFALLVVLVVRPVSVWAVVWHGTMARHQRRLMAWFGIRGVGSLFYLAVALESGVQGPLAHTVIGGVLVSIALSILLHGFSATPLMEAYQQRMGRQPPPR
jgi:NhaP-type Na+/H+ or K+/H+ antiporter